MVVGELFAGRFRIERAAGSGGMGAVFRALDLETGRPVAVKVLHDERGADAARFEGEARTLAALSHPGVVRYVAHGIAAGRPYLVMEWLDGESLEERLAREALAPATAVALGVAAAEALGWAHARGVVHRDVKPSNLFLCGGDVAAVRVLDFGIARRRYAAQPITRTGVMMGTPGYMAPEQARGEREVDARADVFSLGCVLFEALAGQPAFSGAHVMAVLAKVLLEEPPRLRDLLPSAPAELDALIDAMLRKEPAQRPRDGAEVAAALRAIEGLPDAPVVRVRAPVAPAITSGEQRLVSVLLVAPPPEAARDEPPLVDIVGATAPAAESQRAPESEAALRALAARFGGELSRLADGTRIVTVLGERAATDQAVSAARSALAMRGELRGRAMVLATGRGRVDGRALIGEAIDRAALRLRALQRAQKSPEIAALASQSVLVDELTAGLLDERFDVRPDGEARRGLAKGATEAGPVAPSAASQASWVWLFGERRRVDGTRTLLGRPTPCVGRDRELRALEDAFEACVDDGEARAVVVTAEAGTGKSRLRHEFVQRVRARGGPADVWIARGDPVGAGARFGMLAQVVQKAARIQDGEPIEERRRKLQARVAASVAEEHRGRVAEFLGEMVDAPFPDEGASLQLQAARGDARLMGDQIRRAWIDFADAELRGRPLVLVLEDLQWGDLPTVELVDATLRVLAGRPLFVLALARPEVKAAFPELWSARGATEIRLRELSRKACEKLAREVLGAAATDEAVERLAERSGGNAFLLEELLRAEAEGASGDMPGTVLAMIQSRLMRLGPAARRALRAGSVLGPVFWRGAVLALVGADVAPEELDALLVELERDEWIARRPESRFKGETEIVFRHALVREAAYEMLTDDDRALGHRLAAAWLASVGETSPMVVAEHLVRGRRPGAAIEQYRRGAEQAQIGNDWGAVLARVERAVACGASGDVLGELLLLRADAHRSRGEHAAAEESALAALNLLPRGGVAWFQALGEAGNAAGKLGHTDLVAQLAVDVRAEWPKAPRAPHLVTVVMLAPSLFFAGRRAEADALCAFAEAAGATIEGDPMIRPCLHVASYWRAVFAGDTAGQWEHSRRAADDFERAGDLRSALGQRSNVGSAASELGAYDESARTLRHVIDQADRLGLRYVASACRTNLSFALLHSGAVAEARAAAQQAIAELDAQGGQRMGGAARLYLAMIELAAGDLDAAERAIRAALAAFEVWPASQPAALATLASIARARGDREGALEHARRAFDLLARLGTIEEGEAAIRLTYAEVLRDAGEADRAREVIVEAREHLLRRAARIGDASWRASFLERAPVHARTLALAREWAGA
jgi:tetratricopeptide (TPR) repeat protein